MFRPCTNAAAIRWVSLDFDPRSETVFRAGLQVVEQLPVLRALAKRHRRGDRPATSHTLNVLLGFEHEHAGCPPACDELGSDSRFGGSRPVGAGSFDGCGGSGFGCRQRGARVVASPCHELDRSR